MRRDDVYVRPNYRFNIKKLPNTNTNGSQIIGFSKFHDPACSEFYTITQCYYFFFPHFFRPKNKKNATFFRHGISFKRFFFFSPYMFPKVFQTTMTTPDDDVDFG